MCVTHGIKKKQHTHTEFTFFGFKKKCLVKFFIQCASVGLVVRDLNFIDVCLMLFRVNKISSENSFFLTAVQNINKYL